jgi:hypothetical protein
MDRYPDDPRGAGIGVVVDCEGGRLIVPSYSSAFAYDRDGKLIRNFRGGRSHFANFIKAVRSRSPADLTAPILEGHISSALCHTGNISYRLGRQLGPDVVRERLQSNGAAAEAFGRMSHHLAANGITLENTRPMLGLPLLFDPAVERFPGDETANGLLTRAYRAPFAVPDFSAA